MDTETVLRHAGRGRRLGRDSPLRELVCAIWSAFLLLAPRVRVRVRVHD